MRTTSGVEMAADISADRPVERPEQDLFGYAPFAKQLAESICSLRSLDGLVIAVYGPWGAGKTTLLNLVRHYISAQPEKERPVVVLFNPWWFSGQEDVALAFLGQLEAAIPTRYKRLKQARRLIGQYADQLSTVADVAGCQSVAKATTLFRKKQKDIPEMKEQIAAALRQQDRRILVLVDDIDRLSRDELGQLFKAIKALADFPNVVYVLALDKNVAAAALSQCSRRGSGQGYMDKIVQVPFELPAIDRISLRNMLFEKLDKVIAGTPEELFDSSRWGNVYFGGIDSFIRVPRDVVRLINSLSVTYRAVCGEVNAVDFIAIESIRLFVPDLYDTVRANPSKFAGPPGQKLDLEETQAFHKHWIDSVPESFRRSTRALMIRIFPKLQSLLAKHSFGGGWDVNCRSELRICSADIFPVYFRFAVAKGNVSRSDLEAVLQAARSREELAKLLRDASGVVRPDGTSKCRELLDRLLDLATKDIAAEQIPAFVSVLLDIGDELVVREDEPRQWLDCGNDTRVVRLVLQLLERQPPDERCGLLTECLDSAAGIGVAVYLLRGIQERGDEPLVDEACLTRLKQVLLKRIRAAAANGGLVDSHCLLRLLGAWREWGKVEEVRTWIRSVMQDGDGLVCLLTSFQRRTLTCTLGDEIVRERFQLELLSLNRYIDVDEVAVRVNECLKGEMTSQGQRVVLEQFAIEYAMIQNGKHPDETSALSEDP